MAVEWYCRMMGTELGPFSAEDLVQLARQQRLTPEDWVRRGKDGQWMAAYLVDGVFGQDNGPSRTDAGGSAMAAPKAVSAQRSVPSNARSEEPTNRSLPTVDHYEQLIASIDTPAAKRDGTQVDWFCICHGEKLGPISFNQLRRLAADGQLDPKARVWSSASPKWCRAADVPGLMS